MSLLPGDKLPVNVLVVSDKIIHALIYFGLTLLLSTGFIYTSSNVSKSFNNREYLISALFSLVFGILIEVAQEKMNIGRSGDWKDVIANLFGIVIVYPFMKTMQSLDIFKKIFSRKIDEI